MRSIRDFFREEIFNILQGTGSSAMSRRLNILARLVRFQLLLSEMDKELCLARMRVSLVPDVYENIEENTFRSWVIDFLDIFFFLF